MRYIWIVMIIILEIIWIITSAKDFVKTCRNYKINLLLDNLDWYTLAFILVHLIALFGYSLSLFVKERGC